MNDSAPPSSANLDPVILSPDGDTVATVVWLHGLGADGHDFVPFVQEMGLLRMGVRFVFPQAPVRPVTLNGGLPMRAWYDLVNPEFGTREDAAGISASSLAIVALLKEEMNRGIPAERIVLAGFSQGGAIALHIGLRLPYPLAGLIGLSTYLPLVDTLDAEFAPGNEGLPVFSGHGSYDPLIPIALGEIARERLESKGIALESHNYAVEHGVTMEEMVDIRDWLIRTLNLR